MKNKFDPVAYYKGFTLGYIMVAWLVIVFWLKQSELWLLPALFVYFFLSAVIFRSYYYGMVGNSYYLVKKFDKAYKYYKKAISLNTINVPALYNYALDLLHNGKAEEALPLLERAEKYNTKLIYAKNIPLAIGSCYWVMGELDKAIDKMKEIEADFDYVNPSTLTTLGYLYFLKGDAEKGEEYTKRALEDNPEHAPALDNMGQIYYSRGDLTKAKEYFEKALYYKENMVDSLYYMGVISEAEGDKEKAIDYLTRASKCNVSSLNTVTLEQIKAKISSLQG